MLGASMNNTQFANLQTTLEELTFVQLKRLRQHIEDMISSNHVGKAIAVHEEGVAECAHCGSQEFTKYGTTARGQQRYKCKACGRTFNSLTGTPLSGMKKQDKWHQYSEGMWFTAKIREAASELGINVKTAWRWRHQLLSKPRQRSLRSAIGYFFKLMGLQRVVTLELKTMMLWICLESISSRYISSRLKEDRGLNVSHNTVQRILDDVVLMKKEERNRKRRKTLKS